MYQSLIWLCVASYEACGLRAPFHAERLEREADALVDGVWRDVEFSRDLFRRKMLVHERKAIELTAGELRNPLDHLFIHIARVLGPRRRFHEHISEQTVPNTAGFDPSPKQLTSIRLN
jgi:hypothetical protein